MLKKFKKSSPAPLVPATELRHGPSNPISGPSVPAKAMPKMNVHETSDILKPDVIIAVMGATGSGKSTFINLISGSKLRVGTDLNSCTTDVDKTAPFTFQDPVTLQDRKVVLFDTPGFDDTTKSDTDILKLVAKFLAETYQNGAILSGVIYMHRISDGRMGGIAVRNFGRFRKLCGENSLKNVIIVTNFWSDVDPALGAAREDQLRNDDVFFKPALDKQAKLLRHDGSLAGASIIVAAILGNDPMALDIQLELVVEKKSILETAAGTELNRELVEEKRKHAEALRQVKEDMVAAMAARDEESRKELQMAEAEMERMRADFLKLAANQDEERARVEERLADMTIAAKESTAEMKDQEQIRAQEQQRSNAERDTAQKEMSELKRRHEEERGKNTQMKKLQEQLQAQEQQRFNKVQVQQQMFNAEQDAMRKEVSELKRRHEEEREKDTHMKEQLRAQEQKRSNELADVKQQLDVMESSNVTLLQASADAEQKSQVAVAAAEAKLKEQARKHEQELKEIREEMEAAIRERDEESQQDLLMAEQKLKAEMERLQTEFQKRFNADRDAAQKEVAELKRMHKAERKHETQMKELQEQQRFNEQLEDMKRQLKIKESSNAAHIQDAADVRRNLQAATVAAERSRKELAKSKQELRSSKSALVQERADARQKSQTAAAAAEIELAGVQRRHNFIESNNASLNARVKSLMQEAADARQKSQAAVVAAETELANVKRQLDVMESSNAAPAQDSANADQKSQVAAATAERELADVKWQLDVMKSSNAALEVQKKHLADTRKTSQAAAAAAERELVDVRRQLGVMESSNAALLQDSADAERKSQAAVTATERELVDVRRQLEVMESRNPALDARVESLVRDAADVGQKLQAAVEAPIRWLADFLLHDQVTLHDIYKTGLLSMSEWQAGETIETYRRILGIIIISQVPLTDVVIKDLLGLGQDSVRACRTAFRPLGSVIQWSEGQSARILHQSFSDYLTDESACSSEPWFIDVNEHQRALTLACLRIMNEGLYFNMGDLKTSYIANADVPRLPAHVEAVIPQSLSYACRFWGYHLRQTIPGDPSIQGLILRFFELKFLYWLEVLSLSGEMPQASRVLVSVMEHVANPSNKVYAFAQDGLRFVGAFAPALACSTPHIYLSCVPFAPRGSLIKQQYTRALQNTLKEVSGMEQNWSALQQVLEGHTAQVSSVVFSPDGQRIASGSHDSTICIWDAQTGALIAGPFKGHTEVVYSVAFSPDGQRIASGSWDKTVRVWDAQTGALIAGPFKGHTDLVLSVAFSPDGQHIVSGSADKTIRICDAKTGALVAGPFTGHTTYVRSVAFSPDAQHIASGSYDKTVRIWDAQTGALITGPLKGHTSYIQSAVFSPDGQRIASGSGDSTIRIWDAKTGTLIAGPFKGHTDNVNSVAFSPDGQRIASGSFDGTARIWDVKTGTLIAGPFTRHASAVYSVAFSPDGQRIVSGSHDNTVRIWDATTGPLISGPFEGHKASVSITSSSQQQHSDALGGHSQLKNGWMVNTSGGLLFYVPHARRAGLWWRHDTAVTSSNSTRLDLTRFVHGEDWVRCHI